MSTNASITVKMSNGKYKNIYLHWDGYPKYAGKILTDNYNTQERAEEVISLGNLSVLTESMECPTGHTFETPAKGYSIAYGRDREEDNQEAREYDDGVEAVQLNRQAYNYLWNGDEWITINIMPLVYNV